MQFSKTFKLILSVVLCSLILPAAADVHKKTIPTPAFKTCKVGDLNLTFDALGTLRFVQYGHRYPDNVLKVRQSYDRARRLTGISVVWNGFAGQVVDARASYNAQGKLIKETGYRRKDFAAPLASYIKAVPKDAKC